MYVYQRWKSGHRVSRAKSFSCKSTSRLYVGRGEGKLHVLRVHARTRGIERGSVINNIYARGVNTYATIFHVPFRNGGRRDVSRGLYCDPRVSTFIISRDDDAANSRFASRRGEMINERGAAGRFSRERPPGRPVVHVRTFAAHGRAAERTVSRSDDTHVYHCARDAVVVSFPSPP